MWTSDRVKQTVMITCFMASVSGQAIVCYHCAGLSYGLCVPRGTGAEGWWRQANAAQWSGRATYSVIIHVLVWRRHRQRSNVCQHLVPLLQLGWW